MYGTLCTQRLMYTFSALFATTSENNCYLPAGNRQIISVYIARFLARCLLLEKKSSPQTFLETTSTNDKR